MIKNTQYFELEKKLRDKNIPYPSISGEFVKNRETFFDTGECGSNRFYQNDYIFDYLLPIYRSEIEQIIEPDIIADYNLWHSYPPSGGKLIPVSLKFKQLIEQFKFPPNKFYPAKIKHRGELHPFFVWQVYENIFEQYIDFELTRFNNLDSNWKLKEGWELEVKKFDSINELENYSCQHWSYKYNYQRLVLKPAFREIDYCIIPTRLGVVVSERLKQAIEASDLIGIQFRDLPIKLEFSDEV